MAVEHAMGSNTIIRDKNGFRAARVNRRRAVGRFSVCISLIQIRPGEAGR